MSIDLFAWLRASGWAALAGAAALLTVHTASAQDCAKDSDCGDGYVCQSSGPLPCQTVATPACAPGEKCPDPPPPAMDCQPMEYKSCAPAPCSKDSDCPDDMVCFAYTSGGCASAGSAPPTCAPGEKCPQADPPPAPEPQCTTETMHECTPRYLLPCQHDADCGDGFKCKEQISTSCSGSSGSSSGSSGGSDPGAGGSAAIDAGMAEPPPAPEPPSCTSQPTGMYMCELQVVACDTAADCPANFECQDNPNRAVCLSAGAPNAGSAPNAGAGGAAIAGDAGVDVGNAGAGGSVPDDSCGGANDGLPKSVCLPHGYGVGRGVANDLGEASSTSSKGAASGDPSVTPPAAENGADGGNGGQGGTTGSTHNAANAAAGSGADKMNPTKASGSGCAVAAPGSDAGNGWGLLGVLGMSALLLRRRARKAA